MELDVATSPESNSSISNGLGPNKPTKIFGQIPAWCVKLGVLPRLKPSEIKIFVAIVVQADNKSQKCQSTLETLAKLSGVTASTIPQATHELAMEGLIDKKRRGNRMTYTVNFQAPGHLIETGIPWTTRKTKSPKSTEFDRDNRTGRFIPKFTDPDHPNFSEVEFPKNVSDSAKSLTK